MNPVNCIVNFPNLFMRLSKLCVYAKVRSGTEAQRSSRIKAFTHHTSKQAQCDGHIFAQKVNKSMQIQGLNEFYLFPAKYYAILFNFILHAILHFSF